MQRIHKYSPLTDRLTRSVCIIAVLSLVAFNSGCRSQLQQAPGAIQPTDQADFPVMRILRADSSHNGSDVAEQTAAGRGVYVEVLLPSLERAPDAAAHDAPMTFARIAAKPQGIPDSVTIKGAAPAGNAEQLRVAVAFAASVVARLVGMTARDFSVEVVAAEAVDATLAGPNLTTGILAALVGRRWPLDASEAGVIKPNGDIAWREKALPDDTNYEHQLIRLTAVNTMSGSKPLAPEPLSVEQMMPLASQKRGYAEYVGQLLKKAQQALLAHRQLIERHKSHGMLQVLSTVQQDLDRAKKALDDGRAATALFVAIDAYGRAMAVVEIARWLSQYRGGPKPMWGALIDWLFYASHYGGFFNTIVFSARGVIDASSAIARLLQAIDAKHQAEAIFKVFKLQDAPNEALKVLVRGHGYVRSAQIVRWLFARDSKDRLIPIPSIVQTTEVLAHDAQAQHAYVKLTANKLSGKLKPVGSEWGDPKLLATLGKDLEASRTTGLDELIALAAANVSLRTTSQLIYWQAGRVASEGGPASQRSIHGQLLARFWGAIAKSKSGRIPPEAAWHFALAQEHFESGEFAAADAFYDAVVLDCRTAVLLRKSPTS